MFCPLHNDWSVVDTLKATRSCRARAAHQVPASAAVCCKPCHISKCYTHYLDMDSIHSVVAITLSEHHDGDATWHQFHRNNSPQYREQLQRVIEDEQKGARPNASHRLAYLAKTFTTCRPIAPEVTKPGWYDRFTQTASIPVSHDSKSTSLSTTSRADKHQSFKSADWVA